MRKRIEEKLGCTIEEYIEKQDQELQWAIDHDMFEIDRTRVLADILSEEEIAFMAGYVDHMYKDERPASA